MRGGVRERVTDDEHTHQGFPGLLRVGAGQGDNRTTDPRGPPP